MVNLHFTRVVTFHLPFIKPSDSPVNSNSFITPKNLKEGRKEGMAFVKLIYVLITVCDKIKFGSNIFKPLDIDMNRVTRKVEFFRNHNRPINK